MHTIKVIAAGLALLGLGYSVAEEAPIFAIVFAVPAVVALLVLWSLSRG